MWRWLTILTFLPLLLAGCNWNKQHGCPKSYEQNHKGEIFLIGAETSNSPVLKTIIESSDIQRSGYVLIITGQHDSGSRHLSTFNSILHHFKVFAIHEMVIGAKNHISKSEAITIENAALIFVIFTNNRDHTVFLSDTLLIKSLQNAHANSSAITAISNGVDVMGEFYIDLPKQQNDKPNLIKGLGLVKERFTGMTEFYESHSETIFAISKESGYDFVGIGKTSAIQICHNELFVISETGLLLISSKKQHHKKSVKSGDFLKFEK